MPKQRTQIYKKIPFNNDINDDLEPYINIKVHKIKKKSPARKHSKISNSPVRQID